MTNEAVSRPGAEVQSFLRDNRTRGKRQAITVYEAKARVCGAAETAKAVLRICTVRAVRHDGQAPRVVEGYTVSHDTFRRLLISSWSARPERLQNGRLLYALARSCMGVNQFKLLAERHAATGRVNRENGCSHLILAGGGRAAQRNRRRQAKCPTVN